MEVELELQACARDAWVTSERLRSDDNLSLIRA